MRNFDPQVWKRIHRVLFFKMVTMLFIVFLICDQPLTVQRCTVRCCCKLFNKRHRLRQLKRTVFMFFNLPGDRQK